MLEKSMALPAPSGKEAVLHKTEVIEEIKEFINTYVGDPKDALIRFDYGNSKENYKLRFLPERYHRQDSSEVFGR
jgi:hypothetical protein